MYFWQKLKYVLCILMLFEMIMIALHIFSQGFLLSRDILNCKSSCTDFKSSHILSKGNDKCPNPKKFNKTILILIDALRYDFASYNASIKNGDEKFYQNKMKIFRELLSSKPRNSKLLKFIADPPTTTMQRLKGLTTGSLPTFIDASHNFASSEITEDNIIDQIIQSGLRIKAFGDDTWGQLYPNRFHKSFLYPSFNVMDLDGVDDGILSNLFHEMRLEDSDFIIAHFLGVDHCGHRYGMNHFQMERKLLQMNSLIKNITDSISDDTLLVVIGDHGMTSSGDHGGDSKEEIESALFFHSHRFNFSENSSFPLSVSQVDLVPTLSILLGIPIPCSNLGKVIEEALDFESDTFTTRDALVMNYQQISRYLHSYNELNNEFPLHTWKYLNKISESLKDDLGVKYNKQLVEYLTISRLMCEEIWAKFDLISILIGLISLFCILLIMASFLPTKRYTRPFLYSFRYLVILFLAINTLHGVSFVFNIKTLDCIIGLLFVIFSLKVKKFILPSGMTFLPSFFVLLVSCGTFSNSLVVSEDLVCSFIFTSFISMLGLNLLLKKISQPKSKYNKLFLSLSYLDWFILCISLSILISVRISRFFLRCREEQHWCESSTAHVPMSALDKEWHNTRYLTSIISLILFLITSHKWLSRCGNLNGWDVGVLIAMAFPTLGALLCGGFWALQGVQSLPENIANVSLYLPRFVYFLSVLGFCVIYFNPLFVYILPTSHSNNVFRASETSVIPQLFMVLKKSYEQKSNVRKTPVVYGLATSISAPIIVILILVFMTLLIIGGDGMGPGIILLIITGVLTSILNSIFVWNDAKSIDSLLTPNWCSICTWFLLSLHGFYATGHQPTFTTLNWFAAFVGFDGTGSYWIPALLVVLNTFTSQIIFGLSLPLILVVPFSIGFLYPSVKPEKIHGESGSRGEYLLVERSLAARESIVSIAVIYICFHSFKVLLTALSAFILRRHLMVWKIFAPHFVFECVGLMVSCVAVFIGVCLVFRVISALENWTKKLQ